MSEDEAKAFAKEIKAIFKLTSAMTAIGIDDLFNAVGKKILDPNYVEDYDDIEPDPKPEPTPKKKEDNSNTNGNGKRIKLDDNNKDPKKKKKCCGNKKEE